MAVTEQGPGGSGLQHRIKNILFSPAQEWDRIDAEPATIKSLYVGYACILAAIWPIASFIGGQLFGHRTFYLPIRPPLISSLLESIAEYVLSLGGVFVLALAIDILAPSFGAVRSRIQALKVAVYACTAIWIFLVFQMIPPVSALSIIGIYSLYLMYLGIPKLMKAPADKAALYSVVSIVVALAIWIVVVIAASRIAVA